MFDLTKLYLVNLKTGQLKRKLYVGKSAFCKLESFLNRDSIVLITTKLSIYYWEQILSQKSFSCITFVIGLWMIKQLVVLKLVQRQPKPNYKTFEIRGWRPRIFKFFEITWTIYSNSERSEQFLVTDCFFNLFLEISLDLIH